MLYTVVGAQSEELDEEEPLPLVMRSWVPGWRGALALILFFLAMALGLVPYFAAMDCRVSPFCTVYFSAASANREVQRGSTRFERQG